MAQSGVEIEAQNVVRFEPVHFSSDAMSTKIKLFHDFYGAAHNPQGNGAKSEQLAPKSYTGFSYSIVLDLGIFSAICRLNL